MTNDLISRQDALRPFCINSKGERIPERDCDNWQVQIPITDVKKILREVPSAELPKEYAKSVWLWMLNYQIKSAELQGRYTPYEILSWVANDWRKENGLD